MMMTMIMITIMMTIFFEGEEASSARLGVSKEDAGKNGVKPVICIDHH